MRPNDFHPGTGSKLFVTGIVLTGLLMIWLSALMPARAAQIRIAADNSEIHAAISIREVNRISLEDDRIKSVARAPIGYDVVPEPDTGDLYLVPSYGARIDRPVNMFITSERGFTYQLLLTPSDTPSEQLIIQGPRKRPLRTMPVAPRRQAIADLMRGMINGDFMDAYRRRAAVPADLDHISLRLVDFRVLEVWEGERFSGLSLELGPAEPTGLTAADLGRSAAAAWIDTDAGPDTDIGSGIRRAIIIMEAGDE